MNGTVNVSVHVDPLGGDRLHLVLAVADAGVTWSKVYDGSLFLSLDAQALGLLEEVPIPAQGSPKQRLKKYGTVSIEALDRMRFVKVPNTPQAAGVRPR